MFFIFGQRVSDFASQAGPRGSSDSAIEIKCSANPVANVVSRMNNRLDESIDCKY